MMEYFIFYVTVSNLEEGKKIGKSLVENKLAACVNIVDKVHSIYEWQGKIEEDTEFLLIIKTTSELSDQVIDKIEEIHSYDVPECIGFKIEKGSKPYLDWIGHVTKN